jgi:hypothetical protein
MDCAGHYREKGLGRKLDFAMFFRRWLPTQTGTQSMRGVEGDAAYDWHSGDFLFSVVRDAGQDCAEWNTRPD